MRWLTRILRRANLGANASRLTKSHRLSFEETVAQIQNWCVGLGCQVGFHRKGCRCGRFPVDERLGSTRCQRLSFDVPFHVPAAHTRLLKVQPRAERFCQPIWLIFRFANSACRGAVSGRLDVVSRMIGRSAR